LEILKVKIHKLRSDVDIPCFETSGAVGFDLASADDVEILAGEIKLISTGLVIETPKGYALILASRSSTPKKKGLTMPHGIGVIDQDYCGPRDEIKIQVKNFRDEPVIIKKGEKIAQGMFVRVDIAEFECIDEAPSSATRGGFGSTG
jgi:dUTP pyrophosphatase